MRVVLASVIGLCCTFHSVWAVEVATVQTTPNSVAAAAVAPPAATTKPTIIPVAATASQALPATGNKPRTAEELDTKKAQQDAKVKALVKDQATRLQQLEKANLEALAQNQELQLRNDN